MKNKNELNYQQARIVRKQSLKDVIADELIRGKGLGSAITGAIGLKTQALVKGIKAKFDPLNLVKFLTFGSRLGPALYGKLFGRSQKDVEYFTGRAKPIGRGRQKLVKDDVDGEGENTGGMKTILKQILTFLQKSHEDDMTLREKENNLRESNKLDDDVRHRELLKALGVKTTDEPTATPVEKPKEDNGFLGGLMDSIKAMIKAFEEKFKSALKMIDGLLQKVIKFADALGWVNKIKWLASFLGPLATTGIPMALLIALEGYLFKKFKDWLVEKDEKLIKEAAAEGKTDLVEARIKVREQRYYDLPTDSFDNTSPVDEVSLRQRTKKELKIAADAGSQKAKDALEKLNKEETDKRQEYIKSLNLPAGTQPTTAQLRDAERYVIGQIDLNGGSAPTETEKLITKKVTETLEKWFTPPPAGTPEAERYQKFFEDRQRSMMNNNPSKINNFKPFNPLYPDVNVVPEIKNETDNPKLKRVTPSNDKVGQLLMDNLDLTSQLATNSKKVISTSPTNIASASTSPQTQSRPIPMPSVRMAENSYKNAVYSSFG